MDSKINWIFVRNVNFLWLVALCLASLLALSAWLTSNPIGASTFRAGDVTVTVGQTTAFRSNQSDRSNNANNASLALIDDTVPIIAGDYVVFRVPISAVSDADEHGLSFSISDFDNATDPDSPNYGIAEVTNASVVASDAVGAWTVANLLSTDTTSNLSGSAPAGSAAAQFYAFITMHILSFSADDVITPPQITVTGVMS